LSRPLWFCPQNGAKGMSAMHGKAARAVAIEQGCKGVISRITPISDLCRCPLTFASLLITCHSSLPLYDIVLQS
jgi:hypothetical protein